MTRLPLAALFLASSFAALPAAAQARKPAATTAVPLLQRQRALGRQ